MFANHSSDNFDRSPRNLLELNRVSEALTTLTMRYAESAPWIIDWQIDQSENTLFLSFDLPGDSRFVEDMDNQKSFTLTEFIREVNGGAVEIECGYYLDCLQEFRRGVAALSSLTASLKCDFLLGEVSMVEPFERSSYRIDFPMHAVNSLQHLEDKAKSLSRNCALGPVHASGQLIAAVLDEILTEQGFRINVAVLDAHPDRPDVVDFSLGIVDLSGEDRVTPYKVDEFLLQLKELGFDVRRVSPEDPINADLILCANHSLRNFIIDHGIKWGI